MLPAGRSARIGKNASVVDREHEETVRRSFGQQTHLFTGPDSIFAQREASALSWIEPLHADMIVLDVACGAGRTSEPVAPHVRQVIGVDLTPALLRIGDQRLREHGITNVLLQEANAESLPFVDESFDIVFCRSSLHHFADRASGGRRDVSRVPCGWPRRAHGSDRAAARQP